MGFRVHGLCLRTKGVWDSWAGNNVSKVRVEPAGGGATRDG